MATTKTKKEIAEYLHQLAVMTKEAGFNINLGPVVDLGGEPLNPIVMTHRTFSSDPDQVIEYAHTFIEEHRKLGILTVLKHFPGHGSSKTDTHDGFVDISNTWTGRELEPYKKLIAAGDASAIMTGHLLHQEIASDGRPVTLSKKAISGLLRHDLGFEGLIISDDLQMMAISKKYGLEEALVMAINAGIDLLMIANGPNPDRELPVKVIALIHQAVSDGRIKQSMIKNAWRHIMKTKSNLGR